MSVKGKARGVLVYELLAMNEDATDDQLKLVDAANRAYNRYLERDFAGAIGPLEDILALRRKIPPPSS